jgi:hypothetical protein
MCSAPIAPRLTPLPRQRCGSSRRVEADRTWELLQPFQCCGDGWVCAGYCDTGAQYHDSLYCAGQGGVHYQKVYMGLHTDIAGGNSALDPHGASEPNTWPFPRCRLRPAPERGAAPARAGISPFFPFSCEFLTVLPALAKKPQRRAFSVPAPLSRPRQRAQAQPSRRDRRNAGASGGEEHEARRRSPPASSWEFGGRGVAGCRLAPGLDGAFGS